MKQEDYLQQKEVAAFIKWMGGKLDGEKAFVYGYTTKKPKGNWSCTSLYDAYLHYDWNGKGCTANQEELNGYSKALRDAVAQGDEAATKKVCIDILRWGGVLPGNEEVVNRKKDLATYLRGAQGILNPATCDTDDAFFDCFRINSGFTKIYSLLIPDFIIYDSRVGAALCYLVRLFCEERDEKSIPESLHFSYGEAKGGGVKRCPDSLRYKFKVFAPNKADERLLHNMQAGWLFKAVLENNPSAFNNLDEATRVRALEAALFMIGYALPVADGSPR
jgi:hypothetical protein